MTRFKKVSLLVPPSLILATLGFACGSNEDVPPKCEGTACIDGGAESDPAHNGIWYARVPHEDDFDGGSSRNPRAPATKVEEGGSR